jgi:hypothetical protein
LARLFLEHVQEQLRKEKIDQYNYDRGDDHGGGRRASNSLRPTLYAQPLKASNGGNDEAEK